MNTLTEIQTIKGPDGEPAFVVLPYQAFMNLYARGEKLIPHEVVSAMVDGATAIKAWRQHLGLTQAVVAKKLGITQSAYAQIETSPHPRKSTLRRVATALGLFIEQIDL